MKRILRTVVVSASWAFIGTGAFAQQAGNCGPITNAFGPFDFRTEKGNNLYLVEMAHFTPSVEALISGVTTYVGGDIDYTLRAFPNHHRALMSTMRLGEKEKTPQPKGMRYTVECWFDRAIRFKPDDTTVRMIYAIYLSRNARAPEANNQLEIADGLAKDMAFTHYNIGLIYFDLKNYDKALAQAHKAYGLGFPQPALREQLQAAGKWRDAPPAIAVSPDSPASAAASASPAASDAATIPAPP